MNFNIIYENIYISIILDVTARMILTVMTFKKTKLIVFMFHFNVMI